MIFRRLPASSSFVLAAARLRALQLDSPRAAADPGNCEEDPEEQSAQPGAGTLVTGPGLHALLTLMALMGAVILVIHRDIDGVPGAVVSWLNSPVISASSAACISSWAPSRATSSRISGSCLPGANSSWMRPRTRSIGDTRFGMGVGPSLR
jgi:hypothetical protein